MESVVAEDCGDTGDVGDAGGIGCGKWEKDAEVVGE